MSVRHALKVKHGSNILSEVQMKPWLLPLACLGLGFAALRPLAAVVAAIAALSLLVLNFDLYRFFARKRGWAFACAAVGLHWLYYAYCGIAVAIALPLYLRARRPRN